jgi:hypothetical protein
MGGINITAESLSIDAVLFWACLVSFLIGCIVGAVVNGYRSHDGETYVFMTPKDAYDHGKQQEVATDD